MSMCTKFHALGSGPESGFVIFLLHFQCIESFLSKDHWVLSAEETARMRHDRRRWEAWTQRPLEVPHPGSACVLFYMFNKRAHAAVQ